MDGRGTVFDDAHRIEVIGGRFVVRLLELLSPMAEEAVAETPSDAHEPEGLPSAHRTAVVVGRGVQALVEAVFNAPVLAVGLQLRGRVQVRWR